MNQFTSAVTNFLDSAVFTPLSEWLHKTKGVLVTPAEMAEALSVPRTDVRVTTPMSSILLAPTVKRTSRKPIVPEPPAHTCKYVYTTGAREGKYCERAAEETPLGERCPTHTGKEGGKFGEKKPAGPKRGKKTTEVPALPGLQVPPTLTGALTEEKKPKELVIERIPGTPYCRDKQYGIVIFYIEDGPGYAVGFQDEGTSAIRTPTPEELELLKSFELEYRPVKQ